MTSYLTDLAAAFSNAAALPKLILVGGVACIASLVALRHPPASSQPDDPERYACLRSAVVRTVRLVAAVSLVMTAAAVGATFSSRTLPPATTGALVAVALVNACCLGVLLVRTGLLTIAVASLRRRG